MPPTTTISEQSEPATTPRPSLHALDVVALVTLAVLVRIPAYLADVHLSFDDGVFANSAVAMRDGGVPFRDVFSSQGPMFLPLVWIGDLIGFRTMDSPRVIAVLSGVVTVVAVYWTAIRITDRVGALVAGALVATSGGLAWVTSSLAADGPALAFATITVGLAVRHRDEPTAWRAVLMGLALGACLSTKAMEAPVLVPVVLVLLPPVVAGLRKRMLDTAAIIRGLLAAGASAVLFLAVSLPFGFDDVWDQSVRYRTDAAADREVLANAGKLISTLWDRDLAVLFFGVVALVAGVLAHRRTGAARVEPVDAIDPVERDDSWWSHRSWASGDWSPSNRLLIASWTVVSALWLIFVVAPLWRPHVAAMAPPLVLLIGIYRPALRITLVAAVVALPLAVVQLDGLLAPGQYRGTNAQIMEQLAELPEGAWVISDEPGLVWRSGLRTTDDLVDPSMLRLEQGRYTEESLATDAEDPRVCAVVVGSIERFRRLDGLGERLTEIGFEPVDAVGTGDVLYVRSDCAPTS